MAERLHAQSSLDAWKPLAEEQSMKTTMILVLLGALIGVVIASLIVPPALAWYTTPGGLPSGAEIQAVVQISEVIRYSTSRLIRGQMIGGAIGAATGLVFGVVLTVRQRRPRVPTPAPPATRTTPA